MRLNRVRRSQGLQLGWGRWAALGLVLAAGACYPGDGPSNVQDLDVVLTLYDEDVNFGSFQTFAMPDSVVHVGNDTLDILLPVPRTNDDLILGLVADNMIAAGYTRELDPQNNGADLIMLVAAVATEQTEYWAYDPWGYYWGYYPGWGYGGYPSYDPYGYYYPPSYVGSVTFEQGSLLLILVDPRNTNNEEDLPIVWSGVVRGLMNYGGETTRLTETINQAFSQSPYLGR
jgi:hypothetical protein